MSETGRIVGLCVRTAKGVPPEERTELCLDSSHGVVDDHGNRQKRQVTVVTAESWRDAQAALGEDAKWTTRRANVLVEAVDLSALLIGGTLRLGECEVEIVGETFPCDLMDQLQPGLKAALLPETRGGVYGRIAKGGTIKVGEVAEVGAAGKKKKLP
jgi:MOSC domain-containing protein YiiM